MNCLFINQGAFATQFDSAWSLFTERVLQLFFYNKFFPIFSFLFGFGIATQILKKKAESQPYHAFFIHRMSTLFIIGLLHISLLWSGDVVHLYALLGMLSLAVIKLSNKALALGATTLLVFPFYDHLAQLTVEALPLSLDQMLLAYGEQGIIDRLRHGNYRQTIVLRWHEYLVNLPMLIFYLAPMALAMFLLGIAARKSQITFASEAWLSYWQTPALWGLVLSMLYKAIFLWLLPETDLYRDEMLQPIWFKLMFLSDISLGLVYLWLIAFLWHRCQWQVVLTPFAYVGRLALTNYLLQSFTGLLLFTSVGLSLYQTLSPEVCFVIALLTFITQALLSRVWLRHFQYGPVEWLWRCISYRKRFVLRRKPKLLSF